MLPSVTVVLMHVTSGIRGGAGFGLILEKADPVWAVAAPMYRPPLKKALLVWSLGFRVQQVGKEDRDIRSFRNSSISVYSLA